MFNQYQINSLIYLSVRDINAQKLYGALLFTMYHNNDV